MKMPHKLSGKNLFLLITSLLLILSLPNALSLNTVKALESPAIYIEPAVTEGTLPLGSNFTISVKTNYDGDDIWSWDFTLTYDPRVLHGGINKTDTWIGNDTTKMFNTTEKPVVKNSEEVYVNQTLMTRITERRTDVLIGDGVTRTFYTTQPVFPYPEFPDFLPYNETVRVDRHPRARGIHYTINYSTSNITFMNEWTPAMGAEIEVIYDTWGNYTIDYSTGTIEFASPPGGVEVKATYLYDGVTNGDLINKQKNISATLISGPFNNAIGKLLSTTAFFYAEEKPFPVTSGPGTLANITFTVVGYGISNITLGPKTSLEGYTGGGAGDLYTIIDADIMPDHIEHGRFINVQLIPDVAVLSIIAPDEAVVGELVSINVTVRNQGNYTESVTLTVYNGTTVIGTDLFTLTRGLSKTSEFNWTTSGLSAGTYTINATATIAQDDDPSDNYMTTTIDLKKIHDVAVTSISAPTTATVGELVPINVTVENQGSFDENVILTVFYGREERKAGETDPKWKEYGIINTTTFTLAPRPTSKNVSLIWNTTDVDAKDYIINATATIAVDEDPGDNNYVTMHAIDLKIHDVAVTSISAPTTATVGETVSINVTVKNEGSERETVINVTVYYDDTVIGTQTIDALVSNASQSLIFSWDTSNVTAGTYTIKAVATPVPGEIDTVDNTFTDGTVTIATTAALDTLLYVAVAGAASIIIAAVAIYFLKIRKPT